MFKQSFLVTLVDKSRYGNIELVRIEIVKIIDNMVILRCISIIHSLSVNDEISKY